MVHLTYFVHSTATDNEKHVSSGWSNPELSELGKRQSEELKEQTKDKKFDVVFCSDLKRAHETASTAWGSMCPVIDDARLRECNYGVYNGQLSAIVEPLQETMITTRFEGGESYEDVKARMSDLIEFVKKNYDGKHVAFVGHKAPQLALEVLLKGKTWEQAFAEDWRKTKKWQPGWEFELA